MSKVTLYLLTLLFLISSNLETLAQETGTPKLKVNSLNEADAIRMKVLQSLHVAQAPLHSKQDKATTAEIEAYRAAVKRVQAFKDWIVDDDSCSLSLKDEANTPHNRATYSKAVWGIHDAQLKLEPPFTRADIGVAVKVMNDAREIMKLPVTLSTSSLPDRAR
jgi:hypothetical protein